MKLRKVQYDLEFTHILTFQENYRSKIAPIFQEPNLRYGLENIGTLEESIKLIFKELGLVFQCNMGAVRVMFEGDPKDFVKGGSPQWDLFVQVVNCIKSIEGFGHITRHRMQVHAVDINNEEQEVFELKRDTISNSKYLKFAPYSKFNEFAIIYENGIEGDGSKVTFGNFSESDINKFNLSPFNTAYNKDLFSGIGYIADVIAHRPLSSFSKSSYKDILEEVNNVITQFD